MQAAIESFGGGAFEYIPKPFDLEEAIEIIIKKADKLLKLDFLGLPFFFCPASK